MSLLNYTRNLAGFKGLQGFEWRALKSPVRVRNPVLPCESLFRVVVCGPLCRQSLKSGMSNWKDLSPFPQFGPTGQSIFLLYLLSRSIMWISFWFLLYFNFFIIIIFRKRKFSHFSFHYPIETFVLFQYFLKLIW